MSNGCGWPEEHCDHCAEIERLVAEWDREERKQQRKDRRGEPPALPPSVFIPVPEIGEWLKQRGWGR